MKNTHVLWLLFALGLSACSAEIGDDCNYDVDCSPNMNRNCDQTQPGGYCLVIGCASDGCPGEAVCVEFSSPCPEYPMGGEDETCDILEVNRARTYCLRRCGSDKDCRDRYFCSPVEDIYGTSLDPDRPEAKVCVPQM